MKIRCFLNSSSMLVLLGFKMIGKEKNVSFFSHQLCSLFLNYDKLFVQLVYFWQCSNSNKCPSVALMFQIGDSASYHNVRWFTDYCSILFKIS